MLHNHQTLCFQVANWREPQGYVDQDEAQASLQQEVSI